MSAEAQFADLVFEGGVGTTEFDITPERRDALYEAGREAASDFLDAWDFDAYVAEFRQPA
jgi:NTE family protein